MLKVSRFGWTCLPPAHARVDASKIHDGLYGVDRVDSLLPTSTTATPIAFPPIRMPRQQFHTTLEVGSPSSPIRTIRDLLIPVAQVCNGSEVQLESSVQPIIHALNKAQEQVVHW